VPFFFEVDSVNILDVYSGGVIWFLFHDVANVAVLGCILDLCLNFFVGVRPLAWGVKAMYRLSIVTLVVGVIGACEDGSVNWCELVIM
jgi:hypothetical protein